jgi:glutaredoxin-related protein
LLSKRLSENCGTKPTLVIYFYGNADICPECVKTGYALSSLRQDYEKLRVYAFDYNLDLPLIKTFASLYDVKENELPTVIINNKKYVGLNTKEEIDALLPKEVKEKNSISATTTKK